MSIEQQLRAFVADVRRQIGIAEDAGADHEDLCVAFPAGYFALSSGWPTIELEGRGVVALVPKLWARNKADEAVAEMGGPPPAPSESQGLWQMLPTAGGS